MSQYALFISAFYSTQVLWVITGSVLTWINMQLVGSCVKCIFAPHFCTFLLHALFFKPLLLNINKTGPLS